jgi:hypothetical protein
VLQQEQNSQRRRSELRDDETQVAVEPAELGGEEELRDYQRLRRDGERDGEQGEDEAA